jgi:hypothetical protein
MACQRQQKQNKKLKIMSIKLEIKRAALLSVLALTAGSSACLASIPLTQDIPGDVELGGGGTSCPGSFTAYTTMTNSTGSIWLSIPAGETNAVLTDISHYPAPYASVVSAMYKTTGMTYCAGDSVSFPVSGGQLYQYKLFVVSGTVTNGQPLTMQITYLP